jgi:hypothetical protein
MYLRNFKSTEFKKEKEVPKEKSQGSNITNPVTNMLTLNNFIDFSDRISKLERENESFQISQARSKQIIGKFERENEDLKIQNSKLEREHQAQYIY